MHIALCDSNIADRKQMERLLMRESDKRINKSGNFYTDTYGSSEALLSNPFIYDAYFLDVTENDCNAYDITKQLRDRGIASPVVFCISSVDYHCFPLLPASVFLNKPILTNELSLILDEIQLELDTHPVHQIEFRNQGETFYLEEPSVLYFEDHGREVLIHLTDGTTKAAIHTIHNLWMELTPFPSFYLANQSTIINTRYVEELCLFSVRLKDQTMVKINPLIKKDIQSLCHTYQTKS